MEKQFEILTQELRDIKETVEQYAKSNNEDENAIHIK